MSKVNKHHNAFAGELHPQADKKRRRTLTILATDIKGVFCRNKTINLEKTKRQTQTRKKVQK